MESSDRLSRVAAIGILAVIAAAYVVNAMDRIVFPTLLPSLAREYGFTLLAGGLQATIFTLGFGIAGIPGGFLLDRMSRKAVAIVGVWIYSISTILTALSVSFYDMAIYRVLSGIGEALQNTAIFTMAGAYFAQNRTLAFGLLIPPMVSARSSLPVGARICSRRAAAGDFRSTSMAASGW
jgi:MFS family permease